MPSLAIIIPTLNEQTHLGATLSALQTLRQRGHKIIVVDGGSTDKTLQTARRLADHCLSSKPGRAIQMNAGAGVATADTLLFLHADTTPPEYIDRLINSALADQPGWGRFDVRLSGRQPLLRLVEYLMNLRSRLSGIATGDQGLFVSRDWFEQIGGFPPIALMEDIVLSRRLKRLARPHCLKSRLVTSSRRWEQQGILRTILNMWWLRAAFFCGVPAHTLARQYDRPGPWRYPAACVLVFARAPQPGQVKTRLASAIGNEQAAEVYSGWLETLVRQLSKARLAPLELWVCPDTEHPLLQRLAEKQGVKLHVQPDGDLGRRMHQALRHSLARYRQAVLIGSDCPVMTVDYVERALRALDQGIATVIGPAEDGGYVLLGLQQPDPALFDNIPWSTDRVMSMTRRRLVAAGRRNWAELETLWDIDSLEDYQRWLNYSDCEVKTQ